ncbi:hypothetical protein R3P38DRAFT_3193180 [Favolaschia claudopus]|uniref:Uncharacterized protein n=1 Tax=Favolaschia claudopus TaxID=2862362 RepID=A0AAW0BID5_9AGAR
MPANCRPTTNEHSPAQSHASQGSHDATEQDETSSTPHSPPQPTTSHQRQPYPRPESPVLPIERGSENSATLRPEVYTRDLFNNHVLHTPAPCTDRRARADFSDIGCFIKHPIEDSPLTTSSTDYPTYELSRVVSPFRHLVRGLVRRHVASLCFLCFTGAPRHSPVDPLFFPDFLLLPRDRRPTLRDPFRLQRLKFAALKISFWAYSSVLKSLSSADGVSSDSSTKP